MRTIQVERIAYSSPVGSVRPFMVQIGDRQVQVRTRRCGPSHDDVERLTIFTTTLDNLPGTRDLAERRHVSTRQRGDKLRVITVTTNVDDDIVLPYDRTQAEIQRFWASIVDFLDQALPGYVLA
jgi:hypothetical protein